MPLFKIDVQNSKYDFRFGKKTNVFLTANSQTISHFLASSNALLNKSLSTLLSLYSEFMKNYRIVKTAIPGTDNWKSR